MPDLWVLAALPLVGIVWLIFLGLAWMFYVGVQKDRGKWP